PISYHTGVPEISVPIYTIQEGTLSLPVSLRYHSSGIRVDEVVSCVGSGWSLNAPQNDHRNLLSIRSVFGSTIQESDCRNNRKLNLII
ncbi:MAG: hypothetical protein WKF87_15115, partial [Chryseolinea sp.]